MLYASFVKPEGIYDSLFNKAVAYVTRGGNFCHSEFVFSWSNEELQDVLSRVKGLAPLRKHKGDIDICFYILWGDVVRYRVLSGGHPFWSKPKENMIHIDVKWESELNTVTWLCNQLGAPYDRLGAILSPIPLRNSNNSYEKYFCSQLMACALQRLGKIDHHNPAGLTPNSLYALLKVPT